MILLFSVIDGAITLSIPRMDLTKLVSLYVSREFRMLERVPFVRLEAITTFTSYV